MTRALALALSLALPSSAFAEPRGSAAAAPAQPEPKKAETKAAKKPEPKAPEAKKETTAEPALSAPAEVTASAGDFLKWSRVKVDGTDWSCPGEDSAAFVQGFSDKAFRWKKMHGNPTQSMPVYCFTGKEGDAEFKGKRLEGADVVISKNFPGAQPVRLVLAGRDETQELVATVAPMTKASFAKTIAGNKAAVEKQRAAAAEAAKKKAAGGKGGQWVPAEQGAAGAAAASSSATAAGASSSTAPVSANLTADNRAFKVDAPTERLTEAELAWLTPDEKISYQNNASNAELTKQLRALAADRANPAAPKQLKTVEDFKAMTPAQRHFNCDKYLRSLPSKGGAAAGSVQKAEKQAMKIDEGNPNGIYEGDVRKDGDAVQVGGGASGGAAAKDEDALKEACRKALLDGAGTVKSRHKHNPKLVPALSDKATPEPEKPTWPKYAKAAGVGALAGALLGSFFGPVGIAWGAAIGAGATFGVIKLNE